MPTEELKDKAEDLYSHLVDYLDTFYKITLINLTEKVSEASSTIVTILALMLVGFFVLVFASIGLAFWLGNLMQSVVGGFMATAGIYLIIFIIIFAMRKNILFTKIRNLIIDKLYD